MSATMLRQGEGASARFDAAQIVQAQRLLLSGRMAGMARSIGRVDANHEQIVSALRKAGASVQSLSSIGRGCPDLLVSFRGRTFVVEVKDGTKIPSKRRLTPDEERWHAAWQGELHVVESVEGAIALLVRA